MKETVLGIETSTPLGGVALVDGTGVIGEHMMDVHGSHGPRLMESVERLLSSAGLAAGDLASIGVSVGPGSFTGLRVGVATAQGLARATDVPLFPVPTMEAVAWGVPRPDGAAVAVVMEARKGELYGALYERLADGWGALIEPRTATPAEMAAEITSLQRPVVLAGTAAEAVYASGLQKRDQVSLSPPVFWRPRPSVIAWLARRMYASGKRFSPHEIVPFYIAVSQAEVALLRRKEAE